MTTHLSPERLAPLRDFFLAQSRTELGVAYRCLAEQLPGQAPSVTDWQQVEFAFNRLFVGPKAPVAPPFASVYLEPEPQLMGRSTLKIRQIYELMGLSLPWKNIIPDDHLSFELDVYRQVMIVLEHIQSPHLLALQQYFLHHHLEIWLPQFINRVQQSPALPDAISFVINQLAGWLSEETITTRLHHPVAVQVTRH